MARGRPAGARPAARHWGCAAAAILGWSMPTACGEIIPGVLEPVVLAPSSPYHITVGVGEAKFLGFNCMGGPADVVITLSTYAERADPLLFLSMNPDEPPSFQRHDESSFGQWKEDAAGDHFVTAKGVHPRGGILGLVNLQHFASEELDGILDIKCTFIIAFDTLFWDHLRNSNVCPIGVRAWRDGQVVPADTFCSGHGKCDKGFCVCGGDYTGPACEHPKTDIVVAAEGHYRFKVETGRYQYFRVRIPPQFPGGYLEVRVMSEQPLVVLVRSDELPTKTNFELSNFDDWINKRIISDLKYEVPAATDEAISMPSGPPPAPPLGGAAPPPPQPPPTTSGQDSPPMGPDTFIGGPAVLPPNMRPGARGRRLTESLRDATGMDSWKQFFERVQDYNEGVDHVPELPLRRLQEAEQPWRGQCPVITPPASAACRTRAFTECKASCERCMMCVRGGHDGEGDRGCTEACDACVSVGCINTLAECAADMSCMGSDALQCEAGCGSCMSCFDSNDAKCSGCGCCISCLPLAAKCSISQQQNVQTNRFAFVGVFNHRRFYNERDVVHAAADISLTADPGYSRSALPPSWIAEMYDAFHDIRSLQITQKQFYPHGEQFIYEIHQTPNEITMEVKLYRDRLTLLHITDVEMDQEMLLQFSGGPDITHILSSSASAPKTFFDFDQQHEQKNGRVTIYLKREAVWVALFGAEDGYTVTSISVLEKDQHSPAVGFALVCVFGLLCALLVLGLIYGGVQKLSEFMGMDPNIPLMERLGCLVRNTTPHESTAALTRTGSLTGYIGSDVIDRSVEDQYLHRGGTGDDGI